MVANILGALNTELMLEARRSLKGKWGLAIVACIVSWIFSFLSQIPYLGLLVGIILGPQIWIGISSFHLSISRNQNSKLEQLFRTFKDGNKIGTAIGAYLLVFLFVFLGFLCLIIPGIILSFAFVLTPYIIVDNDKIGPYDAIMKSYNTMNGYKWKYFCMMCRFSGWGLLSLISLGIGFLWLVPYIGVSTANFYNDIMKNKKLSE